MELEILYYIQSGASPFWDSFFQVVTMLAEQYCLIAVLGWIYWCVDKEGGRFIAYSLLTSMTVNNGIKELLKLPRPIGQPGIRTLRAETATGYSFPSGHTQMISTLGTSISMWFQRARLWGGSLVLMLLVAYSRMYLGVHWPKDVAAGLFLGIGISYLCSRLYAFLFDRTMLYGATLAAMTPLLLVARSHDFYTAYGLFAGFVAGVWYEQKYVRFAVKGPLPKKLLRMLVGVALLGVTLGLGKLLLPKALLFVAVRYFAVGFVGFGLCPKVFARLRI